MSDIRNLNWGTALCTIGGLGIGTGVKPVMLFGAALAAAGAGIKQASPMVKVARRDRAITSAVDVAIGATMSIGTRLAISGTLKETGFNIKFGVGVPVIGFISFLAKIIASTEYGDPYGVVRHPDSTKW